MPLRKVNTTEWARYFEFKIEGDERTRKQLETMVNAAARFILDMRDKLQPRWLSFLGTSGAGKTYLAKRIFRWHSRCGLFSSYTDESRTPPEVVYPREWCNWATLAAELKSNQGYDRLREVETSVFTVFDEIGANRDASGHVTDCLANALCARVGKWTVITSNKGLGDIQRDVDTRVSSRMVRDGSVVVDVELADYAMRNK